MHVVTIVSRNFLPRTSVLARTHREHNPLDPAFVLVVDAEPGELPDQADFSILTPAAKVVAGYQPVMPTFQGQVNEEQILALIAYIESLRVPTQASPAPGRAPARAQTTGASSR